MSPIDPTHRPLLSPWHRLVHDRDRVLLEYGGEAVSFEGRAAQALLPALLPLLDGTLTAAEVVEALGHEKRPAVEHALDLLASHGLLTEGPPLDAALPQPLLGASLLHAATDPGAPPPRAARRRLERAAVAVVGTGAAALEVLRTLRLSGVGAVERGAWDDPPGRSLTVVAPACDELHHLEAWNESAVAAGAPWLQVLPYNGAFAAVGPLYVPGETCCYECYRRRRAANVDYPDAFWALEGARGGPPEAPAVVAAVAGIAALASLRWLVSGSAFSAGVMHALELVDGVRVTSHAVYRIPRCPVCSTAADRALPLPWAEAS